MKSVLLILLCTYLCVIGAAPASAKDDAHVGRSPVADQRQGGETIADAVLITGTPYADSGATCDNIDDYDEVCPYDGSTSPDVVYSFVPAADETFTIDLCGSDYDTKLYVYDAELNLIACNDDYYFDDGCGVYVSYLEDVYMFAGETYYIVIDGYGGDCGAYELGFYGAFHYPVHCPDEHLAEGEPEPHDGYVDTYNGSCELALPFAADFGGDCLTLCAQGGWFYTDGQLTYDHDWYLCHPLGETLTVEAESESPITLDFYTGDGCGNLELIWSEQIYPWEDLTFTVPVDWAPLVYLEAWTEEPIWALPYNYVVKICGIDTAPVATSHQSWSAVKAAYR